MSHIPALKTGIGNRYPGRRSSRFSESSSYPKQVRFGTDRQKPISLTQSEREKRKQEALNFLRNETSGIKRASIFDSGLEGGNDRAVPTIQRKTQSDLRRPLSANLKTYELMGETPISRLSRNPSKSYIYDDNSLKNITRESLKKNPLPFRQTVEDNSSRISKPNSNYYRRNNGLLNSLSNFGSKVFKSILYNEDDTVQENEQHASSSYLNDLKIQRLKQKELDLKLQERMRYLDELDRKIAIKENEQFSNTFVESVNIDKQIQKLDDRLHSILEEVNSSSNNKLIKELREIKEEIVSLRRKQESNNLKFESKFEDMRLENQMNRRKFERLLKDLEEKHKELDVAKTSMKNLINQKSVELQEEKDDENSDEADNCDSGNLDAADEHEIDVMEKEEAQDIIRYILNNRRRGQKKGVHLDKAKVRQIRSNLKKIEDGARINKA